MTSAGTPALASALALAGLLCLPTPGDASSCPAAIIGNPNAPPTIQITTVPPSGTSGTVNGAAGNVDASTVRVSGWAHTDRYYPQPLLTNLYTCVGSNGTWSYATHPGKRVIAAEASGLKSVPTTTRR